MFQRAILYIGAVRPRPAPCIPWFGNPGGVDRFLPLAELYKQRYAMDGPAIAAVPDDCAGSVRIRGLKAFVSAVSGEPFVPVHSAMHYLPEEIVTSGMRDRSEYQWSDTSGGSGSHLTHDSRHIDYAVRSQPSRAHQYGRAPPGMANAGNNGSSANSVGGGGERASRSLSGPGPIPAGYFTSGASLGGGSDGGYRRGRGTGHGGEVKSDVIGVFFRAMWCLVSPR